LSKGIAHNGALKI